MNDLETRIEEVLAAHVPNLTAERCNAEGCDWVCHVDAFSSWHEFAKHQAAVLDPVIAAHVKTERAAELLSAAGDVFDTAIPAEIARWLEARAKRITDPILGPDCQNNKHLACDGSALDEVTDWIIECQCACHP